MLEDRIGNGVTILFGQMSVKDWHRYINDPTLVDAILDRLVHSSVKLELNGDSLRWIKQWSGQ